jgi:DEAD/DEAH box helicase domain-containing protein
VQAVATLALTLCRGRSHDDYYQRPDGITSDPPPPPYVDMSVLPILRRVLAKEVLREAFDALSQFGGASADSVHGEFGAVADWLLPPPRPPAGSSLGATTRDVVADWIAGNHTRIEQISDLLLVGTDELQASRPAILTFATAGLIAAIDHAVASNPGPTQRAPRERGRPANVRLPDARPISVS